jgi:hypothetical protein
MSGYESEVTPTTSVSVGGLGSPQTVRPKVGKSPRPIVNVGSVGEPMPLRLAKALKSPPPSSVLDTDD